MVKHMPGTVARSLLLLLGIAAVFLENAELAAIFMTGAVICDVVRACANVVFREIRGG
jgi:hypothetical protein